MKPGRVAELERLSFRAWPAFEIQDHHGWVLRSADGYSRRLNSVTPEAGSIADLDERLDFSRRWYRERGLDFIVRLTVGMELLDVALADRGFTVESPVDIMAAPVGAGVSVGAVCLAAAPDDEWFDFHRPLLGDDRRHLIAPWRGILAAVEPPTGFAVLAVGGRPVAAGFAVADQGWVGLFQIAVDPEVRRRGFGAQISEALLGWGASEGATNAYLQVEEANAPAVALYAGLGFTRKYTYWYRRAPT